MHTFPLTFHSKRERRSSDRCPGYFFSKIVNNIVIIITVCRDLER